MTLEAAGKTFRRTSTVSYLGFIISNTGEPDASINENLLKAEKTLIRIRPFLISRILSTQLKMKFIESFIDPMVTHELSTIVLRVEGNKPLG